MAAVGSAAKMAVVERRSLHREPFAYCTHPHLTVAADGAFLLVFNRAPRRSIILHPPQDPEYRNVLMRSVDEGRTWTAPAVVPDYGWSGVECAGLTTLRSGRILLNQWQFEWLPLPLAERQGRSDCVWPEQLMSALGVSAELDDFAGQETALNAAQAYPWVRGGGRAVVHLSDDDGQSYLKSIAIDTEPFAGGYGMRGAVELQSGDILLPLSDVPHYRAVFTVRSIDGGESWSVPQLVASGPGHEFEEPAPLLLPSGRILMLLRDNGSRIMHCVYSDDDGTTWSLPQATGITGYPADLLVLPDGRIACVAGRRTPPFGIVMHLSFDQGASWDPRPTVLIDDLPNKDLGYPTAALRSDGDLLVVYYGQGQDGVTGLDVLTVRLR